MKENKWFIRSLIGFFITLLCCLTPLLVVFLGLLGLGVWVGYLDYVLIPLLMVFLIIAVSSYNKQSQSLTKKDCCS